MPVINFLPFKLKSTQEPEKPYLRYPAFNGISGGQVLKRYLKGKRRRCKGMRISAKLMSLMGICWKRLRITRKFTILPSVRWWWGKQKAESGISRPDANSVKYQML